MVIRASSAKNAMMIKNAIYYAKVFGGILVFFIIYQFWRSYDYIIIPLENTQMAPIFQPKEFYMGQRIPDPSELTYGMVVYYNYPVDKSKIKYKGVMFARIAGLPGDRIGFENGKLVRNGELVKENISADSLNDENFPEIIVPRDCVYLLLDNRRLSTKNIYFYDSRSLGPILINTLVGKLEEEK